MRMYIGEMVACDTGEFGVHLGMVVDTVKMPNGLTHYMVEWYNNDASRGTKYLTYDGDMIQFYLEEYRRYQGKWK